MDTKKWKSVLVPTDIYEEIVVISHVEGRTISGQLRIIFDAWKRENLTAQDQKFLEGEMREKKLQEERLDEKKLGTA
jgi:hypothetical protein|tara:strand:+ start:228 stop:458 length:231 start_codon:yes stop_codon:yes gene_type:complete